VPKTSNPCRSFWTVSSVLAKAAACVLRSATRSRPSARAGLRCSPSMFRPGSATPKGFGRRGPSRSRAPRRRCCRGPRARSRYAISGSPPMPGVGPARESSSFFPAPPAEGIADDPAGSS
jgi:hypothetical protein